MNQEETEKKKFKIYWKGGRPLDEHDVERQLYQHVSTREPVDAALSVTRFNSTYIEIADSGFQWAGIATTVTLIVWYILFHDLTLMFKYYVTYSLIAIPAVLFGLFFLWIEWFRWTYYPVRLNRKNQMVYIFGLKGDVQVVPWRDIFFKRFTPATEDALTVHWITGMILDETRTKVMGSFNLGSQVESEEELLAQWEFFRSYMEDGPEAVVHAVCVCMPVSNKRESYFQGLKRLLAHFGSPLRWIAFPFCFLVSIGRWIAMRTSRVPKWPKEIEAACAIDPDDSYVRDASTNPPEARFVY